MRLSPELYEQLRRWADAEFRSVNGQIEFLLQRAVKQRKRSRDPDDPDDPGSADD